jgi:hypothetical protein
MSMRMSTVQYSSTFVRPAIAVALGEDRLVQRCPELSDHIGVSSSQVVVLPCTSHEYERIRGGGGLRCMMTDHTSHAHIYRNANARERERECVCVCVGVCR